MTTVARTLLDLAETVRRTELERAFEAAERLRVLDLRAVEATCRRNRGRHGLRSLVALLADARDVPETRSQLERRFLRLCRDAGLPEPSVNVMVAGYEVDFAWPNRRLVVELDGHEFHRTRAAFERDRVRDAALQLAGQRVIRLTHRRLARDAHGIVATLRSLLADP